MSRRRLPNRRDSRAVTFEHEGLKYRALVSRFGDGSLAELFLDAGKVGTSLSIVAKESACAVLLALQYGVPADVLLSAMPLLSDGEPAGPLGKALKLASEAT